VLTANGSWYTLPQSFKANKDDSAHMLVIKKKGS